jgi:hypothetical protein
MPSGFSLVHKKFGYLTVLRQTAVEDIYLCRCSCGKQVELYRSQLVKKVVRHCGCRSQYSYSTKTHCRVRLGRDGKVNTFSTGEYNSWYMMKCRCCYKTNPDYPSYGGRGITICPRWLERMKAFHNFLEDMGARPVGKTLDRINVNGHYCKENCRWADKDTQMQNRRYVLEANGVELPPVVPMELDEEMILAGA